MKNQLKEVLMAPTIDWEHLCSIIPDLRKLDSTPQDPFHHAEGDVGIHTRMVMEAMRDDSNWQALPDYEQFACLLAGLKHDIAKPQRTVIEDNGRISSKGHSSSGNVQARGILYRLGIEPEIREFVCRIASWHQQPFFLANHPNYEHEFRKLSLTLPLNLLSICARADATGRCTEPPESRQNTFDAIDVFDQVAKDMGIWDKPMNYVGLTERGMYLEKAGCIDPTYAWPTAHKRNIMFAMCGLAGAGKSTLAEGWGLPVIGLDWAREELDVGHGDKRGEGMAKSLAVNELKVHLAAGSPVVFDATNLEKDKRDRLSTMARDYMTDCIFVSVETPYETWLTQNRARGDRSPSVRSLESMVDRWGAPLGDDGAAQVFYNEGTVYPVWGSLSGADMTAQLERAARIFKNPLGKPI